MKTIRRCRVRRRPTTPRQGPQPVWQQAGRRQLRVFSSSRAPRPKAGAHKSDSSSSGHGVPQREVHRRRRRPRCATSLSLHSLSRRPRAPPQPLGLPSVRQISSLNGGSQGTPVSRAVTAPPPASETRPNASHNPSGDAFPALPAAKKPTSAMFSPGYKGPGVLRVHGAAATGPGPWGAGARRRQCDERHGRRRRGGELGRHEYWGGQRERTEGQTASVV